MEQSQSENKAFPAQDTESLRFAREAVLTELQFRRERRAAIFNWSSTALVAAIAGLLASGLSGQHLPLAQQVLATAALLVLSGYCCLWWREHYLQAKELRRTLKELDRQLNIPLVYDLRGPRIQGLNAMVLMALIAVATVWVPWASPGLPPPTTQPAP